MIIRIDDKPRTIEVLEGWTILQIVQDQLPGVLKGECGGSLCCGTCAIRIDEGSECLPPPREDEIERLEDSGFDPQTHRLACQLIWSESTHGLTITPMKEA